MPLFFPDARDFLQTLFRSIGDAGRRAFSADRPPTRAPGRLPPSRAAASPSGKDIAMGIVVAFPAPAARGAAAISRLSGAATGLRPDRAATVARAVAATPPPAPAEGKGLLAVWLGRIRRRRAMRELAASLPERAFLDVGLNRARLLHEGGKPFWVA
jgi:uncharacterized protein YjiS (DUF1127 family)